MNTFGKKIASLRKEKGMSQGDMAKLLSTSISVISRYERDEMIPSIETAKKIAKHLSTTLTYLLGETEDETLLKDPDMLRRLKDIKNLPPEDRKCILYNLDAVLRDVKTRQAYSR